MSIYTRICAFVLPLLLSDCQGPECLGPPPAAVSPDVRTEGQAVVSVLSADPAAPYWLEERLAPWPAQQGDRDLGIRQIVRATAASAHEVVFAPSSPDRLTAAVVHGRESFSAVGVDGDRRPFLLRGEVSGAIERIVVADPELYADRNAWLGSVPPTELRVGVLSEDSVRIAGTADEVVVSLLNDHNAVLAYRYKWDGSRWQRVARTLLSPATSQTPFLPIGASYDNFDAITNPFHVKLHASPDGAAYVALMATPNRLVQHNAVFGTTFEPLRSDGDRLNRPSDVLVFRIERDGRVAWSRLVGVADVDDEVYAVAAAPAGDRVAVVGRARRERGLDNSEWHATITTLDAAGNTKAAVVFDTADSGIAQCAAFAPDGALYVGGTEAFLQNPEGFSLYQNGRPFLLRLDPGSSAIVRRDELLPRTEGHAELRALAVSGQGLWLGGLERGPLTHTGDADRSLIRADGFRTVTEAR
jgi:hypothetical protein